MIYIKASDGVGLAVYDYNSCSEKTVVMIHGWPLSNKIFEYQLEMLLNAGYRVITLDLRGFGNSDTPACDYSYDKMAEDIYTVVKSLRLNSFVLVGFSMGGAIVLRYMKNYKGYGVLKLILLAAAAPSWTKSPDFPYGLTREYVNNLIEDILSDRAEFARKFSHEQLFASPQSESAKDWFESIALSASMVGTVQCAIALRDEDLREDMSCIKAPTDIIHGNKDVVVSSELAIIQNKSIKGSRLYQLENSGHGIMYDQLKRFNDIFICSVNDGFKNNCQN